MYTVRGLQFDIGDCLFVPGGGDEVRFGNVEDARNGKVCLSFAVERAQRRGDSEWFDQSNVLRQDEIDSTTPAQMPEVGFRYLVSTARDRARIVQVAAVDEYTRVARVLPVSLNIDRDSLGQPQDIGVADLYSPVLFATIARWRYGQPIHPLVDVFQDPVGESA